MSQSIHKYKYVKLSVIVQLLILPPNPPPGNAAFP